MGKKPFTTADKERLAGKYIGLKSTYVTDPDFVKISYASLKECCGFPDLGYLYPGSSFDDLNFTHLIQVAEIYSCTHLLKRMIWEKLYKSIRFVESWKDELVFQEFIIAFWVTEEIYMKCNKIVLLYNILIAQVDSRFKIKLMVCPPAIEHLMFPNRDKVTVHHLMGLYHPRKIKHASRYKSKYLGYKKQYPRNIIDMLKFIMTVDY